jgi:hypothetical protein
MRVRDEPLPLALSVCECDTVPARAGDSLRSIDPENISAYRALSPPEDKRNKGSQRMVRHGLLIPNWERQKAVEDMEWQAKELKIEALEDVHWSGDGRDPGVVAR